MKNLKKSVLCMLMAVVMVMTVTATSVIPVQDVYAASVKLNKTSLNLYTRTMVRLTVLNTGAKAKWSSSKPKVASVTSEGYVTARSAGKAKITAVVGKKKLYCNVTVKVKPGEEVKMEFKDCKVQVGKTTRLRLMNIVGLASWKSSNTKIATVDANGNVTGRKAGSATITATYLGKKYTAKVTVISCTTSGTLVIRRKAPLADSGVLNAFDKLGFKYAYDPNVTGFTGKFSAKEHRIIVSPDCSAQINLAGSQKRTG